MADYDNNEREEIYSKAVRAGKRTYFFDVKATRGNDYYLTITESKKYFEDDKPFYKKHKLFLYKEDFEKFMDGLNETVDYIRKNKDSQESETPSSSPSSEESDSSTESPKDSTSASDPETKDFTDLDFEDLGSGEEEDKS